MQLSVTANNTGNVYLHNVTITMPDLTNFTCSNDTSVLLVGSQVMCTGNFTFTQDVLEGGSRNFIASANASDPHFVSVESDPFPVNVTHTPDIYLDIIEANCTKPNKIRECSMV